jgi:hypothetical protein
MKCDCGCKLIVIRREPGQVYWCTGCQCKISNVRFSQAPGEAARLQYIKEPGEAGAPAYRVA